MTETVEPLAEAPNRLQRWAWTLTLFAVAAASGVLAYLLSIGATTPSGFVERHQAWLYWVNLGVGVLLGLVALVAALRLALRVRRGRFGGQLLSRLAIVFGAVALGPGVLIYAVSYSFVNRSIESLFDVRLASALEAGLNLGRATLDAQTDALAEQARQGAQRLSEGGRSALALERLREQWQAERVALLTANGTVLAEVTDPGSETPKTSLERERVDGGLLRRAASAGAAARIEGLEDESHPDAARLRAVAMLPADALSLTRTDRFLLVVRKPAASLLRNALAVQAANLEYQRRGLEREGLRRMYLGTLTLVLVLGVFVALLLAIQLGNQLARPLLLLADGVRKVAAGDLTRKPVFASRDELGGLTRSFADMTDQLSGARAQVERSVSELESARAELQALLDNLTTGVIVFDREHHVARANPSAATMLRHPLVPHQLLPAELAALEDGLWDRFGALADDDGGHWQHTLELHQGVQVQTLLLRGATLPGGAWLLVFDDISEVVSAQRSAAWGEVARRLAHEIKNPLTPIQLSAERLQHKLEAKLAEDSDRAMLARSVATIVNQVQSMKQLVNEFRDYARLPAAQLAPLELNGLVSEVSGLYPHPIESGRLRFELEPGLPPILGDATQLRQVIHNLVQNGLDAVSDRPDGRVVVSTKQLLADDGSVRALRLSLTDNGPGFADQVLTRAFEPYVTTKSKGTGLGLAVVKKIADEHGARIRLSNLPSTSSASGAGGALVSLTFPNLAPAGGLAAAAAAV